MSETPPPAKPDSWTRGKVWRIAAGTAAGIVAVRAAAYVLILATGTSGAYVDDATLTLGASTLQIDSYEILADEGRLSYRTEGASGLFSLYLIPDSQTSRFLAGDSFEHLNGQAFVGVEAVGSSIALPKGTYGFAFVCEAPVGCTIPLHVEIGTATSAPPLDLVAATLYSDEPFALWDHAVYVLQPDEVMGDSQFYVTMPGKLQIEATSNEPLGICLFTSAQFDQWLDTGARPWESCEDAASQVRDTIDIEPGDYALHVECLAPDGERCRVKLDVVFVPEAGAPDQEPASAAA